MPTKYKLCTFNCLYCHYGWTGVHSGDVSAWLHSFPSTEQVEKALTDWLEANKASVDYVTFSGNGEACLHPDFAGMVDVARRAREKYQPQARLAILSNSTCLDRAGVLAGLRKLDVRIMKLDCGTGETFREMNRPCKGVRFEQIVEHLKGLDDMIIQTLFAEGRADNATDEEVEKWIERLSHTRPKEVQIYSIDRPAADSGLTLVSKEKLSRIAKKAQEATGIAVKVF
ncbi:MAG: radical SAM protein [Candidatus Zixiibacteriota bacterium]